MPNSASPLSDVVIVIDERSVAVVRVDDDGPHLLVPVPVVAGPDVIRRVLTGHLRGNRVARVLVSVARGTAHHLIVYPVARMLDDLRAELGTPVIWIPDVRAVAETATPPSVHEDDGEDDLP